MKLYEQVDNFQMMSKVYLTPNSTMLDISALEVKAAAVDKMCYRQVVLSLYPFHQVSSTFTFASPQTALD